MTPIVLLQAGLEQFLSDPWLFLIAVAAMIYGAIFGALPGVSSLIAMFTLIPFAFAMPMTQSLVMFAAIYCGGTFGGAFSSILLNIPGSEVSVATGFDGYPMTQKGLAGKALGAAITTSAIGGLFGGLVFLIVAPYIAEIALMFSDADYLGIILMGLMVVASISGTSIRKGLIAVTVGLLLGTVGLSPQVGTERFAFGLNQLQAGILFVPCMIGVFALGQIFYQFCEILQTGSMPSIGKYSGTVFTLRELWSEKFNMLRSSVLGVVAGFIPGIGATLASFLGYGAAKSMSKQPWKFGTGEVSGVVAPETANNASTGGAMIPLFTMGIPGGGATAMMLAVFLSQGIQPGPMIFFDQLPIVSAVMLSMIFVNLLIIPIGRYGTQLFARLLKTPYVYLVVVVVVFCGIGGFTLRNLMLDPYTIIFCGILGFYWKIHNYPLAPFILGVVLGPMAENYFLRAMVQSGENVLAVFSHPIGLGFIAFGCLFIIIPLFEFIKHRKKTEAIDRQPHIITPLIYAGLFVMSLALFFHTTTWPKPEMRSVIGPAFWPQTVLMVLMGLCVLSMLVWGVHYFQAKKIQVEIDTSVSAFFAPFGVYTFIPIILVALYYGLMSIVGMFALTCVFSVATLVLGGVRKISVIALFTIGIIVVIAFIFLGFMHLYMPEGIWIFADFHYWLYGILFQIL